MLYATWGNFLAYISTNDSIIILAVKDGVESPETIFTLPNVNQGSCERDSFASALPRLSLLAVGGRHVAVCQEAQSERISFYSFEQKGASNKDSFKICYPANVLQICLNDQYAAVRFACSPPQVILHALDQDAPQIGRTKRKNTYTSRKDIFKLERWFDTGTAYSLISCFN